MQVDISEAIDYLRKRLAQKKLEHNVILMDHRSSYVSIDKGAGAIEEIEFTISLLEKALESKCSILEASNKSR